MSASVSEDSVLPPAQEPTFTQAWPILPPSSCTTAFRRTKTRRFRPYSVLTALAMAAGGANGETLREMEMCSACPLTG